MAVLVTVERNVKPEHADDLVNFLRNELNHTTWGVTSCEGSMAVMDSLFTGTAWVHGCHGLTIHTAAHNMVFVEHWDSRQHYEKYLAWRTERGDLASLVGWLDGDPNIRFFDNVGV